MLFMDFAPGGPFFDPINGSENALQEMGPFESRSLFDNLGMY